MNGSRLIQLVDSQRSRVDGGPVVVGIGGGSGSGKSTIAAQLAEVLQPLQVETINQDRFFKPPEEMPTYFSSFHGEPRPTFNHPDSFRHDEMIAGCRASIAGDVVILEGILVLHFLALRSLLHLRCYVTTPVEQMLTRRLERNLAVGYGGTAEEIANYNRECVGPDHRRYNAPTAAHADVLIPNGDGERAERDRVVAEIGAAVRAVRAE